MNFYKINYDNIRNLKIINFGKLLYLLIIIILIIGYISFIYSVTKYVNSYGYIKEKNLYTKIIYNKTDDIKTSNYLLLNNKKYKIKEINILDYEIIDDNIYEDLMIVLDDSLDNEVGLVKFIIKKEKIINYILDLFK